MNGPGVWWRYRKKLTELIVPNVGYTPDPQKFDTGRFGSCFQYAPSHKNVLY